MYKSFYLNFKKIINRENTALNFLFFRKDSKNGFLLIELLIAMTVFSITVAIAAGTFINVLHTQKQVVALAGAQSNVSIAIEQMTREIRTGNSFNSCVSNNNCNLGCIYTTLNNVDVEECKGIQFTNVNGDDITYYLSSNGILERSVGGIGGTVQDLTSSNITVKSLNFFLFGNTQNFQWNPPRITIAISVYPNNSALVGNVLNLETTVSQR
jgi:prepilin-type N-terminal cleavage/methylation domain-containing protein